MKRAFKTRGENGAKPWKVASATVLSFLLVLGQMAPVLGNPSGGAVVAGAATIGSAGATLSINQSTGRAIINWQQFSIAGGETTKFIVPNSGATLNRVVGGNLSAIYGTLQSNGALYLINPSGILVGPSGRINTSSFLASTLDVSNQQFLAGGDLTLAGSSNGTIDNEGIIHASGGDVYLIANQVTNNGAIKAPHGTVGLAAGSEVLFKQAGSQHLFIQSTPAGTKRALGVTNAGTIQAAAAELKAAGGNAYALAINNTGVIAVTGYKKINGQVYLTSDGGSISNSGKISARNGGNGGTIVLDGTAKTSTTSGTVTNSGTLDASATVAGGVGGTVTVKNLGGTTVHSGMILAKGGQGGAGGNAEVSGGTLVFTGLVDLTAPGGTTGTLLLDPAALDVVNGGTGTVVSGQNDANSTTISPLTVENALSTANLTLNADTTLTISNAITWTSATTLTLSTNTSGSSTIVINAPISGVNGGLTIAAAGSDPITTGAAGSVNVASFILQSGNWNQVSATLPAFTASQNFTLENSSTFLRATGGNGSSGTPYQITDVYGLQGIGSPSGNLLSSFFELVNNIDATGTSTWNSGAGFAPIGNSSVTFAGTFNGQNNIINGLYINLPSTDYVGLFGNTDGTIGNVGATNFQVIGGGTYAEGVGLLVGDNNGTISNVFSTGSVTGFFNTGGLVGWNSGTIGNGYSTATVNGENSSMYIGGLNGANYGTIMNSYSTGSVTSGTGSTNVGGFIGENGGAASNSYSTGVVNSGSGSVDVGGFVGNDFGSTSNTFWDVSTAGSGVSSGVGSDSVPNTTAGVTAATTAELESQSFILANSPTAPTWDFVNVWSTNGDTTTPQLIGLPVTGSPASSRPGGSGESNTQASNGTGGIDGSGSSIVPPAIIPQVTPIVVPPTTFSGSTSAPFSFEGSGTSGGDGQQGGGLADSSGNSGQVGGGDVAQLNNGELNNVANPHATGALTAALGPVVYHNLSDALQNAGDFTDVDATGATDDTASNGGGDGETILNEGDVVEVDSGGAKKIALNQAPAQLRNALAGDVLQGVGAGH